MAIEDEQSELITKYASIKKQHNLLPEDIEMIDQMFQAWGNAYEDDNVSVDDLRDRLEAIKDVLDEIEWDFTNPHP